MMTSDADPVEQFRALLNRAVRTNDPFRRESLYRAALQAVPALQVALREHRQDAVIRIRAEHPDLSFADIGAQLKPPLSRGSVERVLVGRTRTGNARPGAAARADVEE